jgi:hypothetical protein
VSEYNPTGTKTYIDQEKDEQTNSHEGRANPETAPIHVLLLTTITMKLIPSVESISIHEW